jgi:hypothetical protein
MAERSSRAALLADVQEVLRRVEQFDPLLRRARELRAVRERLDQRSLGDALRRLNCRNTVRFAEHRDPSLARITC